jgi:hypothetical protein
MSYYTRSGRESRAPGRFSATTSQGVGEGGVPSQNTVMDRNPSQERQGGTSPIRNTETQRRYSPPWTAEMNRSFIEGIRASRFRREEDSRRGSGAMPASQTPEEPVSEWTRDDDDLFLREIRQARARRLAGGGSGPAISVGHADGSGSSNRSVVVEEVNMTTHDTENTPNPRSQASDSIGNASTGADKTEGGSGNAGNRTENDSAEVVTASGRPAAVPPWVQNEIRRHQQARDREGSILSEFPEGPTPSISVGGSPDEFKILSLDIDDKGSPQY